MGNSIGNSRLTGKTYGEFKFHFMFKPYTIVMYNNERVDDGRDVLRQGMTYIELEGNNDIDTRNLNNNRGRIPRNCKIVSIY